MSDETLNKMLDRAVALAKDAENELLEDDKYVGQGMQWLRRAEMLALVSIAQQLREMQGLPRHSVITTEKRYMTSTEVGLLWGVTSQTVRNRIASGELAAHRIGREYRVLTSDALEFLSTKQANGTG